MNPTIGRIVFLHSPNALPRPAIIVNVHDNNEVSLQVFQDRPSGTMHFNRVSWAKTEGVADYLATWDWPPRE